MAFDLSSLQVYLESGVIDLYNVENIIDMFPQEGIPSGMAVEEWARMYIGKSVMAAYGRRGIDASTSTIAPDVYKIVIHEAHHAIPMSEGDIELWTLYGALPSVVKKLGEAIYMRANSAVFVGPLTHDTVASQYNWILEPGTGTGSPARPLILTSVTKGAWTTTTNLISDCGLLVSQLVEAGFNLANTVVLIPNVLWSAYYTVRDDGTSDPTSAILELQKLGISKFKVITPPGSAVDDAILKTQAGAAPTMLLHDMIAIDLGSIVIGIEGTGIDVLVYPDATKRPGNYVADARLRFATVCIPHANSSDEIVKGVSLKTACIGTL